MESELTIFKFKRVAGHTVPATLQQRAAAFVLSVLFFGGLGFFIASIADRLPVIGPAVEAIRESDIDTGAFFYDSVKEVFEAEDYMRYRRYIRE